MELKSIKIENFRSVKDLEVEIDHIKDKKCFILFGVNETGKSNILKAIALLDKKSTLKYDKDCNKEAKKNNDKINVRYNYLPFKNLVDEKIGPLPLPNELLSQIKIEKIEHLISYDKSSARTEKFFIHFKDGRKFNDFIYVKSKDEIILKDKNILNELEIDYEDLTDEIFNSYLIKKLEKYFTSLIPEVIFWTSTDEYLITKPIPLNEFSANPNKSIPLRNIFNLAGYNDTNLSSNIERIKDVDVRKEIEKELSKKATEHINKLWAEHKVNIDVRIEGNECFVSVMDKDNDISSFNMEQRSDGFKQFISILLTLSVENKVNKLKNKLILLDEPERSLHPSSVKYLRDELLDISTNNIVFVSSHSIHMVDKKKLERHFTVKKKESKTYIEKIDANNHIGEEIIYEALGTSIFEIIGPNIIIFEGTTDKDLFDNFTMKLKEELNPETYLTISAGGTSKISPYVSFFIDKLVKGYVIVDYDQDGKNVHSELTKNYKKIKGHFFTLKDLVNLNTNSIVLEDLLPQNLVVDTANTLYNSDITIEDIDESISILESLKNIKREKSINKDHKFEDLKSELVNYILDEVKNSSVEELKEKYQQYCDFIKLAHTKLKEVR